MTTIRGTQGKDVIDLVGEGEDLRIIARGGNDDIKLESFGTLDLFGGPGNEEIELRDITQAYVELGGGHDDIWIGTGGRADVLGGAGNDFVHTAQVQVVHITGGEGHDSLGASHATEATLDGGNGDDALYLFGVDRGYAAGGEGNDYFDLFDCGEEIVVAGGNGNDIYYLGRLYHPTIVEEEDAGIDTVQVRQESYTAHANIENIQYEEIIDEHGDHDDPPDTIRGNDLHNRIDATGDGVGARIFGGGGDDLIRVSDGRFFINGESGDDVIFGSGAGDTIKGGSGDDRLQNNTTYQLGTLEGGSGRDTFVADNSYDEYEWGDSSTKVLDFEASRDRIELIAFEGIGGQGVLASRFFHAGTGDDVVAQDRDDRIIFNRTTGDLFYDADGNGAGAQFRVFNLNVVSGNFNYADIDVRLA
jgi:serralysin